MTARTSPGALAVSPLTVSLLTVSLLTACGIPIPSELPATPVEAPRSGAPVDTLVPLDEGSAALSLQLRRIIDRVAEVRVVLGDVVTASADPALDADGDVERRAELRAELRTAGEDAVGLLLGAAGGGTGAGLLPAVEPDRGGTGTDDLITGLITSAGDVGGERSRIIMELVRDPLLGDLGAWQRDPVGVIALLSAIAATHTSTSEATGDATGEATGDAAGDAAGLHAALDAALLEIPGELTRALGYALTIAGSDDPRLSGYAAQRATGHLGVVIVAVELALERLDPA